MKKLIVLPLLLLCIGLNAQAPFFGDRVFISMDKQDTMTLKFVGDTVYFISDNGFFKFSKAISVDSIRLKDGKWIKGIVTTETDPRWISDSAKYSPKSFVGKSIKDSLSTIKPRLPIISIKPTRDSINYEMTGYGKTYKIPVTYTVTRPLGCASISSVKIDFKTLTIPALSEGAAYTGIDTILFAGPDCPTCVTSYSKTFNLKAVSGRDTVTQSLTLNQYFKIYAGPVSYYTTGTVIQVYDNDFLNSNMKSEILVSGNALLKSISPVGSQLVVGIPIDLLSKTIYVNGLPYRFIQYTTRNNNHVNKRNAAHKYVALVSAGKIKGVIQTIEIK